jgi:NAD(P)-dependent dehydrogenase (short-subunit alcohol dehydrogenase family)
MGVLYMQMGLKGKHAVVTGGGMGIGQAVALGLAEEGVDISILDVNAEAALDTASRIEEFGCRGFVCDTDVSQADAVDASARRILQEFGRIDILVNNAGTSHPPVSILDLDLEYLEKIIDLNFKGVYFCARRFGKEMVKQKHGIILNIASVAGLTSLPLPVYGPLKSAIITLTQILARDWARNGVRVNAIAPGYVMTPLQQSMIDKGLRNLDKLLGYIPMKTFIMPADIANAAVFLSSEKARFITGVTLPVDAGFLSAGGWQAYGYD